MKKNVLIFSVFNDFNALELAAENLQLGNNVYFLQCDQFLKVCQHNRYGNSCFCHHCKSAMTRAIKSLGINKTCHLCYLSELISDEDIKDSLNFQVKFDSVQTLKDLKYKDVSVGYGAFSSYVTTSRNVMPDITKDLVEYIGFMIRKEVAICNMLERLHHKIHFDEIILHNARFAQQKPFMEFARINHLHYICTEHRIYNGKLLKNNFIDDIPHSIDYISRRVLDNWENGDSKDREYIGKSFFEKRKNGVAAGDKVYTKLQHKDELPVQWDENVENIAIFNSSEDEFCAVSKDYDSYLLFPYQYDALKTIFEHYKNDGTKHFYLRIHPNLINVPYKSHIALYKLKYDNVTIIPGDSSISSYALMDSCDKVIIFNSTMGPEASYWGKPVIALTKFIYTILDFVYTPTSKEELWKMIETKNLSCKKNDNVIKYGYYLLHPNNPEIVHVPYEHGAFSILWKNFSYYSIMTFLGSHRLSILFEYIINKIPFFSEFKKIPCTESYKE